MIETLCIFEDGHYDRFFPLTLSRPVTALPFGSGTLADRLAVSIEAERRVILCRDYLAEVARELHPGWAVNEAPTGEALFVNACVQPVDGLPPVTPVGTAVPGGGGLAIGGGGGEDAAALAAALRVALTDECCERRFVEWGRAAVRAGEIDRGWRDAVSSWPVIETQIALVETPWDLVHKNGAALEADLAGSEGRTVDESAAVHGSVVMEGPGSIVIGADVTLHGGVVLDASEGPIRIDPGTEVLPQAALRGPLYVGPRCRISMGAKIYGGTSLGPVCKVGGEVAETLIAGYSNKQHDGFLGHSVLGSWLNLGADTNNSDLKNNYSPVRFWSRGDDVETGELFVGLVAADHAKTGIGALLNTGTYLGFASAVFGAELPPKFVPSFSWGSGERLGEHELERAIETARRMMTRRERTMRPHEEELFRRLHAWSAVARRKV